MSISGCPGRRRPRASWLVTAVMCAAALGATGLAGEALIVTREVPAPDAILSLASHEWERLPEVTRLAVAYPAARVLLTEPAAPTIYNCHRCSERGRWLEMLGVEQQRVVILPRRVRNTFDEAVAALEYSQDQGIRRLMVVTSPYHTRRTLATFSSVFADTPIEIGVHAGKESPAQPDRWWMASYDRAYVAYEWAALVWYGVSRQVSPLT